MRVPLSKAYKHFTKWVWPNKLHFVIFISIILLLGSTIFLIVTQKAQQQTDPSEPTTTVTPDEPVETGTSDTTPENPDIALPAPPAFAINKVFFSEAPLPPSDARKRADCSEGQNITFPVVADVTHTGSGLARYHWEVNPRDGSIQKTAGETIELNGSGVTKVNANLSYTIADTASIHGMDSPFFYNRLHINLVFNEPNLMYANLENPIYYGSGDFIWGTYLDICE